MYKDGVLTYLKPLNYRQEWSHLFRDDFKYLDVVLNTKTLKNVFVNHYGLALKNGLLVRGCAPNIGWSTYDKGHYFMHWRKAIEQQVVSKYGKSVQRKNLDAKKTYLLVHSPWFSYYFWITECLPRLLAVENEHAALTLIYPENWKNISFVNETLANFPTLRHEVIPQDVHMFVPNLVMPEVKPWTPMFIPDQIIAARDFLFNMVQKEGITSPFGERLYISRKHAARKKFTDEEAVERCMSQLGFETVCMEMYSFKEQIAIMHKAKEVVAITGAGTINALFMKSGGVLIDIPHKDYILKDQYKFHFYKMCNIVNIDYAVFFANRIDDPAVDHYSKQNLIFKKDEFLDFYMTYISNDTTCN